MRILDISALSSATSVGGRLWHVTSIAVIYSLQGVFGVTAKFVPLPSPSVLQEVLPIIIDLCMETSVPNELLQ